MINDYTEIQFPKLGWTFHIDPTAFTIGSVEIKWYGIIIALGLALAAFYCFPRMKRFGIDSDRAVDAVLGGVIGGIIGARLYYVIAKWSDFKKDNFKDTFLAVINTRSGGLAIYGGIIGAMIVGLIICKIRKIKILPMLDIAGLGFLIGQGVGRWGNFVNQEAFGTNTDFFLGMTGGRIQEAIRDGMQVGGEMSMNGLEMVAEKPVHPCFLYESVWCLIGFVLLSLISKRRKYDGQIFLMYTAWYGLERAIVEGLRTDSLMAGSIRISQLLSIVLFISSVIVQIVLAFKVRRDPESFALYVTTEESRMLIEESRRKSMGMKDAGMYLSDDDDEIGILESDDDEDEDDDDESEDKDSDSEVEAKEKEDSSHDDDSEAKGQKNEDVENSEEENKNGKDN